MYLHVDT